MKDSFDEAKKAARKQMELEAELAKQNFIREIKKGLGEQLVAEFKSVKPSSKRKLLWNKILKILGV